MNIGIYNFKTLKLSEINKIIFETDLNIDEVFIYTENTTKERIEQRKGLEKIIEDYKKGAIDVIVFEKSSSLGTSDFTKSLVIKEFMKNKCRYYCVYNRNRKKQRISFVYDKAEEEFLNKRKW